MFNLQNFPVKYLGNDIQHQILMCVSYPIFYTLHLLEHVAAGISHAAQMREQSCSDRNASHHHNTGVRDGLSQHFRTVTLIVTLANNYFQMLIHVQCAARKRQIACVFRISDKGRGCYVTLLQSP